MSEPQELPEHKILGDVDVFGVAIMPTSDSSRHAAIVYHDRDLRRFSVLHLAWHYDLRNEPYAKKYMCVPCVNFEVEELEYFAEHASRISSQNIRKGIPYGISYSGAAVFNGQQEFIDEAGAGLTCATFILAFFKDLGFEILDLESWVVRDDDKDWQQMIYSEILKRDPAKAQSIKAELGNAFRYRPEEVVASVGAYDNSAIAFSEATALGLVLLREVYA